MRRLRIYKSWKDIFLTLWQILIVVLVNLMVFLMLSS